MARFNAELPNDLMKEFADLEISAEKMIEEMVTEGAKVVEANIRHNIVGKFKNPSKILEYLQTTRVYKTPSDGGINRKIAFYGYKPTRDGKTFKITKQLKGQKNKKKYGVAIPYKETYEYEGIPVPLIVAAREYGTSSGEKKKPFFRKSFKKSEIEAEMKKVQEKYLPKE